jgi:tRNA-2-methylthio-N6-dimethylallyladenosine synthase
VQNHQDRFNAGFFGRSFDVLFEREGRRPGQIAGKSPHLQPVQVIGPSHLIGEVRRVTVNEVGIRSLFGTLDGEPVPAHAMPMLAAAEA